MQPHSQLGAWRATDCGIGLYLTERARTYGASTLVRKCRDGASSGLKKAEMEPKLELAFHSETRRADAAGENAVEQKTRSIPLRLGDPGLQGQAGEQYPHGDPEHAIEGEGCQKRQHPITGHSGDEAGFHGLQLW